VHKRRGDHSATAYLLGCFTFLVLGFFFSRFCLSLLMEEVWHDLRCLQGSALSPLTFAEMARCRGSPSLVASPFPQSSAPGRQLAGNLAEDLVEPTFLRNTLTSRVAALPRCNPVGTLERCRSALNWHSDLLMLSEGPRSRDRTHLRDKESSSPTPTSHEGFFGQRH